MQNIEIGTKIPLKLSAQVVDVREEDDGYVVIEMKVVLPANEEARLKDLASPLAQTRVRKELLTDANAVSGVLMMLGEHIAMDLRVVETETE